MKLLRQSGVTLISVILLLLALYIGSSAQNQEDSWKGFARENFEVDGRKGRLILPNKPLPGNPWLWRARFPDWHTEADSILVAEGFHIAYINTDNLYGSPRAVKIWNQCYEYLTKTYQVHEKVALAGVSRGGLFVYNWAKENPEKVTCIYAEAPVCDFTSWPGGLGEGEGSAKDWKQLKEEYGFASDEEAQAYTNNPIDNLEPLANAKIPVLHMVGLEDKIVPYAENTEKLVERYRELGGIATVVPCTKGEQSLQGHHFPIETPRYVAEFIKYHTFEEGEMGSSNPQSGYLSMDGAWCWFSDPRAIYEGDEIVTGWVKVDGSIEAMAFSPQTGKKKARILYPKLESDDHNNPAFVRTADGEILATYTTHSGKDGFFLNKTQGGIGEFAFGKAKQVMLLDEEELKKFPKIHVTYANPYSLSAENGRIYCFGRWTGYKPNMMWSDDKGNTWSKSKVFITNYPFDPNNRPYVKYFSDGQSKIHIVFTDGHPRVEPTNSVYYAYYEQGAFYRADGSKIADMSQLPFEPKDATTIFQSNLEEGRAWIADIAQNEQGNPVILYTKSPSEEDHRYWYASYIDGTWINTEMCKAGKWFPQTQTGKEEREPHYFGNMSLHPANTHVVYLSREVNEVFEIERWETKDHGKSWSSQAITQNSNWDNVRPYVPRNGDENSEVVLWMENQKYIHYRTFQSSIKYHIYK